MSTNFIDGVTNVEQTGPLGYYLAPDPSRVHQWFDDFDRFLSTQTVTITDPGNATVLKDWLVTQVTGTTGTITITDEDGGVALLTNSNTNSQGVYAQWQGGASTVSETFTFSSSKAMWMKARFKLSTATNMSMVLGLIVTDTTPQSNSDGLYFTKADASTTLNFNATASSASTTVPVGTLANDTYVEVGFAYLPEGDGSGSGLPGAYVYLNTSNGWARVGSFSTFANFPSTELAVTFGATNGAAGTSTTMSVDYILVAKAR